MVYYCDLILLSSIYQLLLSQFLRFTVLKALCLTFDTFFESFSLLCCRIPTGESDQPSSFSQLLLIQFQDCFLCFRILALLSFGLSSIVFILVDLSLLLFSGSKLVDLLQGLAELEKQLIFGQYWYQEGGFSFYVYWRMDGLLEQAGACHFCFLPFSYRRLRIIYSQLLRYIQVLSSSGSLLACWQFKGGRYLLSSGEYGEPLRSWQGYLASEKGCLKCYTSLYLLTYLRRICWSSIFLYNYCFFCLYALMQCYSLRVFILLRNKNNMDQWVILMIDNTTTKIVKIKLNQFLYQIRYKSSMELNFKAFIQFKFQRYMDKQKGKRINFKIVHCSSEDPEYPVSELLQQSPDAKGWLSKRFSEYPQQIVIQLFQTSIINRVAILSHQNKIATKIEFEMKVSQTDQWKKIGRISLDSNVSTQFRARQLKQANINIEAKYIKLVLRNNHVNNYNIFNQVGLISVCFYGQKTEDLPPVQEKFNNTKNTNQMDKNLMNRINQLEAQKKRALDNQDYDLCKNIKDQIERLKRVSSQISALEQRKQQAIRRQNYQDAKIINEQIKKLKQGPSEQQSQKEVKPAYRPEQQRKYTAEQDQTSSVSPMTNTRNTGNIKTPQPLQEKPRQPQKKQVYQPPPQKNQKFEDDDRPINVKTNPQEQAPSQEPEPQKQGQIQQLNKQLYDECSQYFSVLDEQIFKHLFSKNHANRQRGLEMVLGELKSTRNRQEFIGACLYIIKNLIDDKVASVLLAVINLLAEMLKKLKPQQSPYNQPFVDYILQKIGQYLGHNNEKIKGLSEATFSNLPIYHLTNKQICYRALSNIGKRDKPPKVLTGRLKMLNKIVREYQLGKDYEQVIKYAVKYADDKNSDVRAASIALLCSIAAEIGYNALQPYLKNLRPPIIKSIEEKLQESGNMEEPQSYDEKPIKAKQPQKANSRNNRQQQQLPDAGNEFIQIPKKGANKQSNQISEDHICQFCKRVDKRFAEQDYKDMHYFNACPMLIICSQCGQGIQISTLTAHLVGECANSKYYKRCPRCKEAVHQKYYKVHMEKKECLPAKPMAAANRCPLCHLDINAGVNGWKEHLVDEGCENNPRA